MKHLNSFPVTEQHQAGSFVEQPRGGTTSHRHPKPREPLQHERDRVRSPLIHGMAIFGLALALVAGAGCGTAEKKNQQFFTSGNRAADQRASQRMAKAEQLAGTGERAGEEKPGQTGKSSKNGKVPKAPGKETLYTRLGGEPGLVAIVDDFTARVLDDPRVNWQRKGITSGGFIGIGAKSVTWKATPANVATLKKHLVQFIALATGGPPKYQGKEIKAVHAGMHITNPEFDASVGDLKASLDKLRIPDEEQKELLAILESTRPQIVTER